MELSDLRQTQEFCKIDNIMMKWISAIIRAIVSNTQGISYICMLISIFTNAGFISIVYPFAVFGYALLEETRPSKYFWRVMLYYSISVVLAKCLMNLHFMNDYLDSTNFSYYDSILKTGLHNVDGSLNLFYHILPEVLILSSILFNEIICQFTGLYDKCETEVEDIP